MYWQHSDWRHCQHFLVLATLCHATELLVTEVLATEHHPTKKHDQCKYHLIKILKFFAEIFVILCSDSSPLLTLATLGDETQMQLFLCESIQLRWLRQVKGQNHSTELQTFCQKKSMLIPSN